jgi:hypothetical protein
MAHTPAAETSAWPPQVDMIMSSLEAAAPKADERRLSMRMSYRVLARLELFSDISPAEPWTLYTRDVNARGIGFISARRVPIGHGGVIELVAPNGETAVINCTVFRCREVSPGWFEGAVYFNREQWLFGAQ